MIDLFSYYSKSLPPILIVLPNGDAIDARTVSGVQAAEQSKEYKDIKDRVIVKHGTNGDYHTIIYCSDWNEACVMRDEVIKLVQESLVR